MTAVFKSQIRGQSYESKDPNFTPDSGVFTPQNKCYPSLGNKSLLRCENYTLRVRTTIVPLWLENYASCFRQIQACKHFSSDWPLVIVTYLGPINFFLCSCRHLPFVVTSHKLCARARGTFHATTSMSSLPTHCLQVSCQGVVVTEKTFKIERSRVWIPLLHTSTQYDMSIDKAHSNYVDTVCYGQWQQLTLQQIWFGVT